MVFEQEYPCILFPFLQKFVTIGYCFVSTEFFLAIFAESNYVQ